MAKASTTGSLELTGLAHDEPRLFGQPVDGMWTTTAKEQLTVRDGFIECREVREPLRPMHGRAGLLDDFVNLRADGEGAVQTFLRRWGALASWRSGVHGYRPFTRPVDDLLIGADAARALLQAALAYRDEPTRLGLTLGQATHDLAKWLDLIDPKSSLLPTEGPPFADRTVLSLMVDLVQRPMSERSQEITSGVAMSVLAERAPRDRGLAPGSFRSRQRDDDLGPEKVESWVLLLQVGLDMWMKSSNLVPTLDLTGDRDEPILPMLSATSLEGAIALQLLRCLTKSFVVMCPYCVRLYQRNRSPSPGQRHACSRKDCQTQKASANRKSLRHREEVEVD